MEEADDVMINPRKRVKNPVVKEKRMTTLKGKKQNYYDTVNVKGRRRGARNPSQQRR